MKALALFMGLFALAACGANEEVASNMPVEVVEETTVVEEAVVEEATAEEVAEDYSGLADVP
jgi:uncharacterized protein YcfL